MRFKVEPRDVPLEQAARRMGLSAEAFTAALPALTARGFPAADPDTGNFDLAAIDRWCDQRHHHLFSRDVPPMGPRDAGDVVQARLAALRGSHGRKDRQALSG